MTAKQKQMMMSVLVISGIEIAFGVIESIILPNFIEQKFDKNWKFRLPPRETIFKITVVLIITGFLSGVISNQVIDYYDQKQMTAMS